MAEAAQQGQQGRWLNWNGVEKLELTWSSIWERSQGSLKNLMLMAYDVYPSPANLVRWNLSRGAHCNLCGMYASLHHILVACPVALAKGWYTCRHNRVLEVVIKALQLAKVPERRKRKINFVAEGSATCQKARKVNRVNTRQWEVRVDKPLPEHVVISNLRPDLVLLDVRSKRALLGELTVPWEENVQDAHEQKLEKYAELQVEINSAGWDSEVLPFEIGCRGFVCVLRREYF